MNNMETKIYELIQRLEKERDTFKHLAPTSVYHGRIIQAECDIYSLEKMIKRKCIRCELSFNYGQMLNKKGQETYYCKDCHKVLRKKHNLFVYGKLKNYPCDERIEAFLHHYKKYQDSFSEYYYIVPDRPSSVKGHLLIGITGYDLREIDGFEGCWVGLYVREKVRVDTFKELKDFEMDAWVYVGGTGESGIARPDKRTKQLECDKYE